MMEQNIGEWWLPADNPAADSNASAEVSKAAMPCGSGHLTSLQIGSPNNGDQLAVNDDEHLWQIKTIALEIEQQDMETEFMHPRGPTAKVQPLLGRKDYKDPPNDSHRTHTGQRQ